MTVYKIEFESNRYQCVGFDGDESEPVFVHGGKLNFDGKSKPNWTPPPVRIANPLAQKGDFLSAFPGCMIILENAAEKLRTVFEIAGELLPVQLGSDAGYILNVTTVVDCLDHDKCDWVLAKDGITRLRCRRFVFRPDWLPESTLFKIPEMPATLFAHSGHGDKEDSFVWLVNHFRLTGIRFNKLWEKP